ncbi:MAG: phytanoyl-CoA dioxygenase family protein [Pseudomonadales bacterium]
MDSNQPQIKHHHAPFNWETIRSDIEQSGGVIVEGLFSDEAVTKLNSEVDAYLSTDSEHGRPASTSDQYDKFLGQRTVRLQGLIEKTPSITEWIGRSELVDWATETIKPVATSVLLNAAELIQIGPGEKNQYLHRDTDSWPTASLGNTPFIVNALIALGEFTVANGATRVVGASWDWDRQRRAKDEDFLRAVMQSGDALLFRGDILHGGGANKTDKPRRALSISYCAGWLRAVENSLFNLPRSTVRELPEHLQKLLGFHMYDGTAHDGGLLGLYENSDPRILLEN